jgi:hypothetical protein
MASVVLFDFAWAAMTPTGLCLQNRPPTWEEFQSDVGTLLVLETANQWALGDAYVAGELTFTMQDPTQALNFRAGTIKTLQNYAWVCRRYLYPQRHHPQDASFSHHAVVAKLDHARREYWLKRVRDEDLSVEDLTQLSSDERGVLHTEPTPVMLMTDIYNRALDMFRRLPAYPEKELVRRGLVLVEEGLRKIASRDKDKRRKAA